MKKEMMDAMYISYNEQIGVLSDNKERTVSQVIGTDLTLYLDKKDMTVYLLVPLTKSHTFECKGDHIVVDGKKFDSDYYFRKDACQWIQMQSKEMLSMVA